MCFFRYRNQIYITGASLIFTFIYNICCANIMTMTSSNICPHMQIQNILGYNKCYEQNFNQFETIDIGIKVHFITCTLHWTKEK